MIKRTLFFTKPYYLHSSLNQLVVEEKSNKSKRTLPIEDVGFVVLEHPQITFSQGIMRLFIEHNVAVIFCDSKFHPVGILLNLSGNSLQSARFRLQLEASKPLKKSLWKQTIRSKLLQQAAILQMEGGNSEPLVYKASQVKSGDVTNEESKGAVIYWKELFGAGFRRERGGYYPNNFLNYGYAILRAAVARAIAGTGLHPTLGIHHRNQYNSFCLADDLMEPYRPFVDRLVLDWKVLHEHETELTTDAKMHLLGVLTMDTKVKGRNRPLMLALSETTSSLADCYVGTGKKLKYASFPDS